MSESETFLYWYPVIKCKFCPEDIPLPHDLLEEHPWYSEEDTDQPDWPSGGWKAIFACISCGHVYEYSAEAVQWDCVPKSARAKYHSDAICFCAEFRCARKDCRTPIKLHVVTGRSDELGIMRLLRHPFFVGDLPCGHPILPLPEREYQIYRVMDF